MFYLVDIVEKNLKEEFKVYAFNKKVFKNRDSLSRWVYGLHEVVNKMLGKKSIKL